MQLVAEAIQQHAMYGLLHSVRNNGMEKIEINI
jgi:hypothetical protein